MQTITERTMLPLNIYIDRKYNIDINGFVNDAIQRNQRGQIRLLVDAVRTGKRTAILDVINDFYYSLVE